MSQPDQAPGPRRPTVSVIVPFAGSDAERASLLDRLGALERAPGDELILADNRISGTAPTTLDSGIVIHPAGGVRSPGFARNRGAAAAQGAWLVFIDADTEPHADLLSGYFEVPPGARTAVLAGRIVDVLAPGPGEEAGLAARHAVRRGHMDDQVTLGRPSFPYAQTANCAIRREAFTLVGGFVEEVRAGEDADLCFRLAEHGYELEARPGAIVRHHARSTLRDSLRQLARHGAGAAWCNRRHPGSFPAPEPAQLARRIARAGVSSLAAAARGDREAASFAALEIAEAAAFELGRLLRNRAKR